MKKRFVILKVQEVGTRSFINYWSRFYDYRNEYIYQRFIKKKRFNSTDINSMFEWKNNMHLSLNKKVTADLACRNIKVINKLKKEFDMNLFLATFGKVGAIWKIFLLHAIQPNMFPIYDQHVHRAFIFIQFQKTEEISSSNKTKFKVYMEEYLPFFQEAKRTSKCDGKKVDEALWAFGKILKSHPLFLTEVN